METIINISVKNFIIIAVVPAILVFVISLIMVLVGGWLVFRTKREQGESLFGAMKQGSSFVADNAEQYEDDDFLGQYSNVKSSAGIPNRIPEQKIDHEFLNRFTAEVEEAAQNALNYNREYDTER